MSSVGQPSTGGVTGADKTGFQPVEYFDDSVKRGYDWKASQSRNDAIQEGKAQAKHRLAQPTVASPGIDSMKGLKAAFSETGSISVNPEDLENINKELSPKVKSLQNNLKVMQGIQQMESTTGQKLDPSKMGELIKTMAEPTPELNESTDKIWEGIWKSVEDHNKNTPEIKKMTGGTVGRFTDEDKAQLKQAEKMFNLTFGKDGFADVGIKVNAINGGPKELINEIKSDYQKIASLMNKGDNLWDTDMLATMLSSIQQKMQNNRLKFDQENIKLGQVEKEQLSKKTISKIRESIEKTEKAKKANSIGKIFSYIGLAIMAVMTVVMIATGVGVVAAGFMIAAMALMIAMTVDQEMGGELMMKPMTKFIQNTFGVDEEKASYIAMGVMMAIMIALSFGAGAGGGAAAGASKFGVMASRVGMVTSGAAAVGEGSSKVAAGVYTYEASMLQADSKEIKAKMLRLQQMIEDATESLQQALEDLQAGHSRIAAIMSNNDDTKKQLGRNLKGG